MPESKVSTTVRRLGDTRSPGRQGVATLTAEPAPASAPMRARATKGFTPKQVAEPTKSTLSLPPPPMMMTKKPVAEEPAVEPEIAEDSAEVSQEAPSKAFDEVVIPEAEPAKQIPAFLQEPEPIDIAPFVNSSALDSYDPSELDPKLGSLVTSIMVPHADPTFTDVLMGRNEVDVTAETVNAPYAPVSARTTLTKAPLGLFPEDQERERENDVRRSEAARKGRDGVKLVSTVPENKRKLDKLAVWGLVFSILGLGFFSFVGVLLSHTALGRIKYGETRGRGIATAGLVLGYVGVVLALVFCGLLIWAQTSPEPIIMAPGADSLLDMSGILVEAVA